MSASAMTGEAIAAVGPKGLRRRLLLLLLPARQWRTLRGLAAFPAGFRRLPPSSSVGLGCLSRASPLLFLFLLPSPRLVAATTSRRYLGDWVRSNQRPRETLGSPSRRQTEKPAPPPRLFPPAAAAAPGPSPAGRGQGCGGLSRRCYSCLVPRVAGSLHPSSFLVLAPGRRDLNVSTESQPEEKKIIDYSIALNKKLLFDTHAIVCLLEKKGFTIQQAEIIVSILMKIITTNMDIVYQDMVSKMQQEISVQQIMSKIAGVKKDMIILEKSEFSALRAENEKLKLELQQLKQQVTDEILKVKTDNKLDFNLEKSRVKELHSQQDRTITQIDRKIDTEVAGLKTMLESHKLDNIKYLAGSVFTCLTVALGFYRLWI
ncbi:mitochondrial calcium uniporter regulator 1 isoform X2 [Gracilinanus agilis]|uniref:mitochondrial calcium uniporter regulator 1 isoform X2 n=1 Tax=Gracilinanus agilis TaxID=191870 RepID=UPI001CFE0146|nr:mitochondrial calcium uniporter regulator 1 isoform X2 [Gracilinanus agilis]